MERTPARHAVFIGHQGNSQEPTPKRVVGPAGSCTEFRIVLEAWAGLTLGGTTNGTKSRFVELASHRSLHVESNSFDVQQTLGSGRGPFAVRAWAVIHTPKSAYLRG